MINYEKISKYDKIKFGCFGFIVLIVIIALMMINVIMKNKEMNYKNENTVILSMDKDYVKVVREVAKKGGDWNNLPLSQHFRKKYNSDKGILNDDQITYLSNPSEGSSKDTQIVILLVMHDLKLEYYYIHYILNGKNELDDVEIVDKVIEQDENGREVIHKKVMDEKWYSYNIAQMGEPTRGDGDARDYIYYTDNYNSKHKYGFISSNGCRQFGISDIEEISSFKDKIVYLRCSYPIYNEDDLVTDKYFKYYKVHYFTDENLWLDDVEVEEVSKEEIDVLLNKAKDKATNSEIN